MTPAINILKVKNINFTLHEYKHDPSCTHYASEASEKLGVNPDQMFKTLIVEINNNPKNLSAAIIPASKHLDIKAYASIIKEKKINMAKPHDAEKMTGYITGGISPLGQKCNSLIFIADSSIYNFKTVYISAGKRGLQVELQPKDLLLIINAKTAEISR
ncbi:MAG TPA: Cys-tRNA(Pro) deacylase [Victivallales bacterium]|nr:Cys-tRNA(Pro) deacylase [Victivallales bacterium]